MQTAVEIAAENNSTTVFPIPLELFGSITKGSTGAMTKEEIDGCIVIGANPVMNYPDREFAQRSLEGLEFLVVADLAARLAGELPVGILTAMIGAPIFVLLLRRYRAGYQL